jgi:hypothetical protein
MPRSDPQERKAANAAYYAANADRQRERNYLKAYGITVAQYEELLESQGGVCAICGRPETRIQQGKVKRLHVDHCHSTGVVRGLLCAACNTGIGLLQDDPDIIARALEHVSV